MSAEIRVLDDPAAAAADLLCEAATGGSHVVLTGGSTPRRAYELIAARAPDWSGVDVWFTDERCVPPSDPLSNWAMTAEALLDRLSDDKRPRAHRIEGERGAEAAADAYEAALRAADPTFALVLLGLGPDAHVASLFPGKPELEERSRLACPVPEPGLEPFVPRVTLTFPALERSAQRVFLVTGASKRDALARCFGPDADRSLPGARVPDPLVLVDREAGEGLA